ncbi:MAG: hypothetical protein KDC34_19770 [Saprospiraceae bacterium]|nr:hypothetical protein [Saprospiraceae bacterium]
MKTLFLNARGRLLFGVVEVIKPIYARLFQRSKRPWKMQMPQLRSFPTGSLGKELAAFIDEHGFELLPLYESHDVYHLLLGFPATVPGEGAMQFCLLGNGKKSPAVYITVLFSLILLPEHIPYFLQAYRKGKEALPIGKWDFQHLLYEPVCELQSMIFRQQSRATGYIF